MALANDGQETTGKVLVVEDSHTQALQLQMLLEKNGLEVSMAHDGVDGLSCLKRERYDLVISDILMPQMDGYELCRRIKEDPNLRQIPVLLLTQLTEPEDIVKGLEAGADNFVIKPYDPDLLISQVHYILINRNMRTDVETDVGVEIFFAGRKYFINSDRMQILGLLFSTYQNTLQQKRELERVNRELKEALDTIKTLHGILPICSNCKRIRDDEGAWSQIEEYIEKHSEVEFSHGICPRCAEKLYPRFVEE